MLSKFSRSRGSKVPCFVLLRSFAAPRGAEEARAVQPRGVRNEVPNPEVRNGGVLFVSAPPPPLSCNCLALRSTAGGFCSSVTRCCSPMWTSCSSRTRSTTSTGTAMSSLCRMGGTTRQPTVRRRISLDPKLSLLWYQPLRRRRCSNVCLRDNSSDAPFRFRFVRF